MIRILLISILFESGILLIPNDRCAWKKNFTDSPGSKEHLKLVGELENCLFYYLLDRDYEETKEYNSLWANPPPTDGGKEMTEQVLRIEIEDIQIHRIHLKPQSTYQFRIEGDIYLNWLDQRLKWDIKEWHMDQFTLHDSHHIWSPKLKDFGRCADDPMACVNTLFDVDLFSDGRIYARIHFAYDSFCTIDYAKYPEEENNCCVFFSGYEPGISLTFNLMAKEQHDMKHSVEAAPPANRRYMDSIYAIEEDHSAWVVDERKFNVIKIAPFASMQMLRVCVHAEKKMSTIAFALRLPVTIATLVMLVSPLFGDLKTQSWVKLVTLSLQTLCFLFLCSIAPPNGFAGVKPKIYFFYELLFTVSFLSILVTISMMALCRVKRSVPPSHRIYLFAKVVNRLVCCIEPEPGVSYQRHIDESDQRPASSGPPSGEVDYTQDWRHIYLAVNNLFAGMLFTLFVFFLFIQMF